MLPELLTREEVRALGLRVTNTTFQRWEKPDEKRPPLLHPIKPAGRYGRTYYKREEVERLVTSRQPSV